jgi:hypothetical protein
MLVRWLVIGGVALIALTVYALVDLFVTQANRVRSFPKPVWIALIVVLPLVGPLLWLLVGKTKKPSLQTGPMFADDDQGFLNRIDRESAEERIRRLEEELRQLDEEDRTFGPSDAEADPGKKPQKKPGKTSAEADGDTDDDERGAGSPSPRS